MSDWMIAVIYLFGILHMIPAWYLGKAAGLRDAARIVSEEDVAE